MAKNKSGGKTPMSAHGKPAPAQGNWTVAADDAYDAKNGIKEDSARDKALDAKRGVK